MHSEEQIERQKQQIIEITGDLQVKTRELKILKFKTLFESPEIEKKETKGGSFVGPTSARATYLARSITKTSDDFKRSPFKDLVDDGKLKPDQTFKHQRVGSHYSQGMESELIAAPPRRKTVGFKEHDRLEDRKGESAVSGFIAVEDVETNKSQSVFERASRASRASEDFELHK